MDNIRFARPTATDEEVVDAVRKLDFLDVIGSLSAGFATAVGERGTNLSLGQRQLICFARAMLADPRILILDEATSSLDSESEAMIQEGLKYLMQGRTTFVIAHRLSTIRRADQILVVETGRIVERGTHEELYAARGRYYDLYTKQHGMEANLFLAPGEVQEPPAPPDGAAAPGTGANVLSEAVRLLRG
jgi:ABC-type multidrug transport system fused ATPase/permease subunit